MKTQEDSAKGYKLKGMIKVMKNIYITFKIQVLIKERGRTFQAVYLAVINIKKPINHPIKFLKIKRKVNSQ